jgi:lipoprotein-anchoring transpeptidase ErfK/SrfK
MAFDCKTVLAAIVLLAGSVGLAHAEAVEPSDSTRSASGRTSSAFSAGSYLSTYRGKQTISYRGSHRPGTIVISTRRRTLDYVLPGGKAIRYGIGVGREGFQWGGSTRVARKAEWPGWTPPAAMRRRQPYLPAYMPGGLNNPLGARALYLGGSLYRIHGTNQPHTIGHAVSSGCIRMVNAEVIDLYNRVRVGAPVVVIR